MNIADCNGVRKSIQDAHDREIAELKLENLVEKVRQEIEVHDVPAFLVYKCRICGTFIRTAAYNNIIAVLVGAINGKQPFVELLRCIHFCDQTKIGVADLIGAHKDGAGE